MTGIYYTELADVLLAAGRAVGESSVNAGWQGRARMSGGFAAPPLGIQWHHTASSSSSEGDLGYMINSEDAPIGNLLLDRAGIFWPIAAGAANTAGKGGPVVMSRGTIPIDAGNTQSFAIEAANNGTGEIWPQAQIDAYFAGSNALSALFGNSPRDVFTHALGEGGGWTSRKIDPAVAGAVGGPWRPHPVTSSGTWSLAEIRDECARRSSSTPEPIPQPIGDEMTVVLILDDARAPNARYRCDASSKTWVADGHASAQLNLRLEECRGGQPSPVDGMLYRQLVHGSDDVIASYGPIIGPRPDGHDEYGRH